MKDEDESVWWRERWVVDGAERLIPYFAVGQHKVWGATAIVLAEFVTALEEASA